MGKPIAPNTQPDIQIPQDNLDEDIAGMLRDAIKPDAEGQYYTDHHQLREALTIYIVQRDHEIWSHAYKAGLERWRATPEQIAAADKKINQTKIGAN